jgi:hypothetical protein
MTPPTLARVLLSLAVAALIQSAGAVRAASAGPAVTLQEDESAHTLGNGIARIWFEREPAFDASLMKPGTNVLQLIVPAGPVTGGVIHDYVCLELDEAAEPPPLSGS